MTTINITSRGEVEKLVRNPANILPLAMVVYSNQTGREMDNGLTIKVNGTGLSQSHKAICDLMRIYLRTKLTHAPGQYGMRIRNEDGSPSHDFLSRIKIPLPRYWKQFRDVWYDTLTLEVVQ